MDDIQLWSIDGSEVAQLQPSSRTESEQLLEETLVQNPGLLMKGLTLVGRQTPTAGGPLDLLGVDAEGRLVVFELKRGTLSRGAVAQIIDYASYLDDLDLPGLCDLISERSGEHGIDKIEDFEEWYGQRHSSELESLKPLRMYLVGWGADVITERMVKFLANNSRMDISLLTFHGFTFEGRTILAKQVAVEGFEDPDPQPTRRRLSREERRYLLASRVDGLDIRQLFDGARGMFRTHLSQAEQVEGVGSLSMRLPTRANSGGARSPYARIDAENGRVRVVFYPRAVQLCKGDFRQSIEEIPCTTWPPRREPLEDADEIHFPLTADEWETHKVKLTELVQAVHAAWQNGTRDDETQVSG